MKSEPRLLLHRGRFLEGAMRAKLVMQGKVLSALRPAGLTDPAQTGAVVLETDGSLSVIGGNAPGRGDAALQGVAAKPEE